MQVTKSLKKDIRKSSMQISGKISRLESRSSLRLGKVSQICGSAEMSTPKMSIPEMSTVPKY